MEDNRGHKEFPDPFEDAQELDDQGYYDKHLRPVSSQSSIWRYNPIPGGEDKTFEEGRYSPLPDDNNEAFDETLRREQAKIDEAKELIGG